MALLEPSLTFPGRQEEQLSDDLEKLAARATECAHSLFWLPGAKQQPQFQKRVEKLDQSLKALFAVLGASHFGVAPSAPEPLSGAQAEPAHTEEIRYLHDHLSWIRSPATQASEAGSSLARLPHVRDGQGAVVPRVIAIAEDMLAIAGYKFSDSQFSAYVHAFQKSVVLKYEELWATATALQFVLLEKIVARFEGTLRHSGEALASAPVTEVAERQSAAAATADASLRCGRPSDAGATDIPRCVQSLREIGATPWKQLMEPLLVFDQVLVQDPVGAYAHMEPESREQYRKTVIHLAKHSDFSEVQIAEAAVELAREAQRQAEPNPRLAARRAHVGCYLIAEGQDALCRRAGVRLPFSDRLQAFLRRYPDDFYLAGIEALTLAITLALLWKLNSYSLSSIFLAAVALLLPCSQSAVEVMNYLVTSLLRPRMLPKLDFERGIPGEHATMVVVPTLLLNRRQVRRVVDDLEVRYLGNMSPNLHFALLTDLPDAKEQQREDDPLVELCGELIRGLNQKYAGNDTGKFTMFHRHRVYNPREGVWMGWERKRGKLLDFNRLILGHYDAFPYKAGDLSILPRLRYVLTLDVDTELPRGTAQRLVGTLAHPLCQAIIDPRRNVVIEGFGILQPRVGISVRSAAQSRLASIYSGQTGFDIYTHAVSDVYQDLYGEGTFSGKGLYEVRTLHQVLDHRFPRNALLSHDLIEGAYTRAGLVNDVEVIDFYPSHYSAYSRRKHRWLRGDWQIVEWLFPRVRDESGRRVPNPISFVSRWTILDNLRRSVIAPATSLLLILGWTILPGSPLFWTLVVLGILFVPPWVQFAFGVAQGVLAGSASAVGHALTSLGTALFAILLTLTFLPHNALVSADAIARTLYRRMVSGQRMLEWETAAQAESKTRKRNPVDLYLLWTPAFALAIGATVFFFRPSALLPALPILILWMSSKLISLWLDHPPRRTRQTVTQKEQLFLRRVALRTWRYFAEFSNAEHNWLIPDNVQQAPAKLLAATSTTNLGILLNARLAAWQFGYLTLPECVEQTLYTLNTMMRLERYRGHLLNWYDTRTLAPLRPRFVSTVDNGNLAAALLALEHGCTAMLASPLLSPALLDGYYDYSRSLVELQVLSPKLIKELRKQVNFNLREAASNRWAQLFFASDLELSAAVERAGAGRKAADGRWLAAQLQTHKHSVQKLVHDYLPWLLPEFESLRRDLSIKDGLLEGQIPLQELPAWIGALEAKLLAILDGSAGSQKTSSLQRTQRTQRDNGNADTEPASSAAPLYTRSGTEVFESYWRLLERLPAARAHAIELVARLNWIAADAEKLVANMDFSFLFNRRRNLLSIGYDVEADTLNRECYDLLASEARIATFIAIAKGDIPQKTWFALGRPHMRLQRRPTLLSWTGTMFEYLMPALWMHAYDDSLLQRAMQGAVREQQEYAAKNGVPWGISESAYSEMDSAGTYHYRAFGAPGLALKEEDELQRLVIAPYATALALGIDAQGALNNLRRMARHGWLSAYGFYEAADFIRSPEAPRKRGPVVVQTWMTHHQGMSLLAITNFLRGDIFQRWFHRDARIQATELLLQERPAAHQVVPARSSRPAVTPARRRSGSQKDLALAS
jgi:hypothetical protein